MTAAFDHMTLSAYVDGELDPPAMREVKLFIENDTQARRYVLDAMHTTMLLKAAMCDAAHEPVPERLHNTVIKPASGRVSGPRDHFPAFKAAAAFALLTLGIGLGSILRPGNDIPSRSVGPLLPAAYQQVVNETLEHHLSGNPLSMDLNSGNQHIIITPIKTYRDPDGRYFRDYYLEVKSPETHQRYKGMAYRNGPSQWRTTALFLPQT